MPGRSGQQKPGTARGSPRRSRTAKASRISRYAAKSRRAREWGGWGRLSDDGPEQHNPDPSEDPWGGGLPHLHGGALTRNRPDTERDDRCYNVMREGRTQTERKAAHAGSRLKPLTALRRPRLTGQPSSRTGENPPYGMIGGIEETSASFEARSAPRSYPTAGGREKSLALPRQPRKSDYPGRRRFNPDGRRHGGTRQRERSDSPARSETLACAEALCSGTGRSLAHPGRSRRRIASGR